MTRLNRWAYFWRMLVVGMIMSAVAGAGANIHGRPNFDPEFLFEGAMRGKEEAAIPLVAVLVATVINFVFIVKRFHDLDKSGWFVLGLLVPFFNIYLWILLLFVKGTTGANRFGMDPLTKV